MNDILKKFTIGLPSVSEAIDGIDSYLQKATTSTVKFLDTHPGIATLLSPGTVIRRTAQKHVDDLLNKQ